MTWRAICDRCGFKRWNHELRKEWDGLMVCRVGCFEARHPQDFLKGKADKQTPPWVRPEPADVFVFDYLLREDYTPLLREHGGAYVREN